MKKITLKGYYNNLGNPQKYLREKIASECGVAPATVFRWLSGETTPNKLQREKIAEVVGVSINDIIFGEGKNE